MLLTFDTDAGIFVSGVPNYVEGSGVIAVVMQAHPNECYGCVSDHFEQAQDFLNEGMHGLYEMVDKMKGKTLRHALAEAHLELSVRLGELSGLLLFVPEAEGAYEDFTSLKGELEILEDLQSMRKSEIKDRLKLVALEIDPTVPRMVIGFGVDGIEVPLVHLEATLED